MLKVLKSENEIVAARRKLHKWGVDCISGKFGLLLRRLGLLRTVAVGDLIKSWDLLQVLEFIEMNILREGRVVDVGAYASETLPALERLGYTNLLGIDLNPGVARMPSQTTTHYQVGDFYRDLTERESLDAITAISVIEHGFDAKALIEMVLGSLKEGGYFLATCDYWPEKVESCSLTPFGLNWQIFSHQELKDFFTLAASVGLHPVGAMDFSVQDRVINWCNKSYTFAWFVLQKNTGGKG